MSRINLRDLQSQATETKYSQLRVTTSTATAVWDKSMYGALEDSLFLFRVGISRVDIYIY